MKKRPKNPGSLSTTAHGSLTTPHVRSPRRMTIVACLLVVGALLAITSLVGDSITFDETSHLTAGYSYLKTGDFRLGPDNPPLGKMWCAWPLLLIENQWPSPNSHIRVARSH